MGEAKTRKQAQEKLAEARKARRTEIARLFQEMGIDISQPGFYDDPGFLAGEEQDSRFAENYDEWIFLRDRSQDNDAHVHEGVPQMATILQRRIVQHNWHGA